MESSRDARREAQDLGLVVKIRARIGILLLIRRQRGGEGLYAAVAVKDGERVRVTVDPNTRGISDQTFATD